MNQPIINNSVSDRCAAGVNVFSNVSLEGEDKLRDYILGGLPSILENHLREMPPGYSYSRRLYRLFSTDPTKHRPSSEALWRRIKKGLDFPFVNPFVDLTNFLSLKYQVPYGLYDLEKISGTIEVGQGGENDSYQGIRKDNVGLAGKLLLKDVNGPFGNPSSDSLRTSTSQATRNILQVIFFHPEYKFQADVLAESRRAFMEFFQTPSAAG
ncbi:MAG: hypothetical protein GY765_18855 [bacterium]|nr:hypothetical protein [bacterium]